VDRRQPYLFRSAELKRFHGERAARSKGSLRHGEFKCFKCKTAVVPDVGSVQLDRRCVRWWANATCPECGGWIQKILGETEGNAVGRCLETNTSLHSIDEDDDDTDLERSWTCALFGCAATRAKTWTNNERNTLVFDVLDQFCDEGFIDTAAAFLVKSDLSHIEGDAADTQYLVQLRTRLWARLRTTTPWKRHCRSPRGGLEIHLNELILAFFCKVAGGFGHATSYTKGLKDEQIIPFLPVLTEIAEVSAPCPSIARLFLDLLELIDPKKAEPFLLSAATSWSLHSDQRFWNELGIGQRVCALAESAAIQPPAQQWIEIADAIAATGVVAGETLKQALASR
jgi:hypothetical protein